MALRSKPRKQIPRAKLTTVRKRAHLTKKELAILAGVTPATISDIESGRNRVPAHSKVVGIIRALRSRGVPLLTASSCFPVGDIPNTVVAKLIKRQTRPQAAASHA